MAVSSKYKQDLSVQIVGTNSSNPHMLGRIQATASNFFGDALFYRATRMTWVVQLSSKGQEYLMTVVKIFQDDFHQ